MEQGQHHSVSVWVRAELAARGWTLLNLANAMGWQKASALLNLLSGNNASARARHRCEQAFGAPIWTAPEIFAARRVAIAFYGADPFLVRRCALDGLARRYLRPAKIAYANRPASRLREQLEQFAIQHYRAVEGEAV